ncbi:MAG: hypothetical protein CM15mP77_2590 [Synechococcus sp.]|nr:MAG: hypothetical protein CM15mP77_2590 [Synechococcus sp.]
MGNLHSVEKAFNRLGYQPVRVGCSDDLDHCDALVLPGVGRSTQPWKISTRPGWFPISSAGMRPIVQCLAFAWAFIVVRVESRRPSSGTWVHPGQVERCPLNKAPGSSHGMGSLELKRTNPCSSRRTLWLGSISFTATQLFRSSPKRWLPRHVRELLRHRDGVATPFSLPIPSGKILRQRKRHD